MYAFRSGPDGLGRKTQKKTATSAQIAAREKPIWFIHGEVNRVRRIGAFSREQSKKLPWDRAIAAELALCLPANARFRKEGRSLGRRFFVTGISVALNGCCGGDTRPWQRLADCRCRYTSFSATVPVNLQGPKSPTTGRAGKRAQKVGATTDPRHGCSVNTAESASRLTRLHGSYRGSGVALTGGDAVSFQGVCMSQAEFNRMVDGGR